MAMNFRDCILGKVQDGKIGKQKGEDVLSRYDALAERFRGAGKTEEAAAQAAEEFLRGEARSIEQRQRNLKQHALKQAELNTWLENTKGAMPDKIADIYQRAAYRVDGIKKSAYKFMDKIADTMHSDFFELKRDYKTFAEGVRAALGEQGGSAEAKAVGQVIKETFDYMHSRYRAAGGVMGKIENYFPQVHSKESIRKVEALGWKEFILPLLDREKMIDESTGLPFTDAKMRSILDKEYQSIVTAGRSDLAQASKEGKAPIGRSGDMDTRRDQSRFFHFKNAESFLAYNRKFGTGDEGLITAFLSKIDGMSRDIGTLELLGPKPHAMSRFLDFKMAAEGGSNLKRKFVNAQYRVLTSRFESGDTDAVWWKVLTGAQNWLRSSMLGSANITAIADSAFLMATSKINGLSAVNTMGKFIKLLAPGDRLDKQVARRSGYIVEKIQGAALSDTRFAGENMGGKFTKTLAGLTNKMSGLHAMAMATQDSISLEAMATVAEHLHEGTAHADLHPDLRAGMAKFGIDEHDWADLAKAGLMDAGDAKFLVTSDLRVDPKIDPLRAKNIADKMDDWIMHLRQMAGNEATLSTRAISTGAIFGDGAPGTYSRAVASSLFMFKSFPITAITSHLLPAIQRARVDRKFDHLAYTMIGATVLGAAAMQIKEFLKGKTPREMDDYHFWQAALLQGGGMGVFGDFFLGDYSRFGHDPITEALGPTVGLFHDIYGAFKGNLDKTAQDLSEDKQMKDVNIGRDLFRVAKRNIPLGSLWYGRLAMERLILDPLERMTDPNFDRRMRGYERKLTKESGQRFWWAPGEGKPDVKTVLGD